MPGVPKVSRGLGAEVVKYTAYVLPVPAIALVAVVLTGCAVKVPLVAQSVPPIGGVARVPGEAIICFTASESGRVISGHPEGFVGSPCTYSFATGKLSEEYAITNYVQVFERATLKHDCVTDGGSEYVLIPTIEGISFSYEYRFLAPAVARSSVRLRTRLFHRGELLLDEVLSSPAMRRAVLPAIEPIDSGRDLGVTTSQALAEAYRSSAIKVVGMLSGTSWQAAVVEPQKVPLLPGDKAAISRPEETRYSGMMMGEGKAGTSVPGCYARKVGGWAAGGAGVGGIGCGGCGYIAGYMLYFVIDSAESQSSRAMKTATRAAVLGMAIGAGVGTIWGLIEADSCWPPAEPSEP